MKIYENQATHITVANGKVTKISDDRLSFILETQKYNRDTKTNETLATSWTGAAPLPEDIQVGKNAVVTGVFVPNLLNPAAAGYQAAYVSASNEMFEIQSIAVINGKVTSAVFNEEKNEDGSPKMTRERQGADGKIIAPKPKTPHFDIRVLVECTGDDGKQFNKLCTVKEYAYKGDMSRIDRYKKMFANFDREENPAYAVIVTRPGEVSTQERSFEGNDGTTHTVLNHYSNHMGIRSIDLTYEKTREQVKENKDSAAKEEAPAPAVETPAPVQLPPEPSVAPAQVDGLTAPVAPEVKDDDLFI